MRKNQAPKQVFSWKKMKFLFVKAGSYFVFPMRLFVFVCVCACVCVCMYLCMFVCMYDVCMCVWCKVF